MSSLAKIYVVLVPLPLLSFYVAQSRIALALVVAVLLAFTAAVGVIAGRHRASMRDSRWVLPFVGFAAWGSISLLLSPYREEALAKGALQVLGLATVIGMALAIREVVLRRPALVLSLVRALVVTLGVVGLIGVAQFLASNFFGRPDLFHFEFANELAGGQVWAEPGNVGHIRRANSIITEPAHFGQYLGLGTGLALVRLGLFGRRLKAGVRKTVPGPAAVFIILGAIATLSLLSYVVLLISVIAVPFIIRRIRLGTLITSGLLAVSLLAMLALVGEFAGPRFLAKVESISSIIWTPPTSQINEEDVSALVLTANIGVMRRNLDHNVLLGVGLGAHPASYERNVSGYLLPHEGLLGVNAEDGASLLVRLLSESGVVGLLLFLSGWTILVWRARKRIVSNYQATRRAGTIPPALAVSVGIVTSCIAVFVVSLIRFPEYYPQHVWLSIALTGCVPVLLSAAALQAEHSGENHETRQFRDSVPTGRVPI